ncbi:hypothetical protein [Agrobacterium bohemicum]|uniref:Uncharacterized protein n=1 Tax=Agrobacterium bohemicum TaxID=2052828 RepID=A0A135P6A0_9HYPH|nr:hypothetical protein [Agrobacterium bohemicum]KXG86957.1 hypothetical protein ATO67_21955 [Agrobacterium bohemicum]
MSSRYAVEERVAVQEHLKLDTLAEELALGAEVRSDEARLYVMCGEDRHLQAFHTEEHSEQGRDAAATKLAAQGLPVVEAEALRKLVINAEELDKIEAAAVEAFQAGDRATAQAQLFRPEHERARRALLDTVSHFLT